MNSPSVMHTVAGVIKKQDLTIRCLQETSVSSKDIHKRKGKGWKMTSQTSNQKRTAAGTPFISNGMDFTPKVVKKTRSSYERKGSIHQEGIKPQVCLLPAFKH